MTNDQQEKEKQARKGIEKATGDYTLTVDDIVEEYNTEVGKPLRDAHGRYLKGSTGNQLGKTPGQLSLVWLLKRRLRKHPEQAEAIVDALVKLGMSGEMRAIEQLLDRIDGKVAETHKIEGELPVLIQLVPAQTLLAQTPTRIEPAPILELTEGGGTEKRGVGLSVKGV